MIENKEEMLAHIPAIQPVANKNLKRMASGYGYRIHPSIKHAKCTGEWISPHQKVHQFLQLEMG